MSTIRAHLQGFNEQERFAIGHTLDPYTVEMTEDDSECDLILTKEHVESASKPVLQFVSFPNKHNLARYGDLGSKVQLELLENIAEHLARVMDPKIALSYKISTQFPFQYNIVPSSIRAKILKSRKIDPILANHLSTELFRKALLDGLRLLGFSPRRKETPKLFITHDIDTEKGLKNSLKLKSIEDRLNVSSIWFLPSDEYPIQPSIVRDLANNSVVGSHDTKHDGNLNQIQERKVLVERLTKSRIALTSLTGKEVNCFRSPLLQFSRKLLSAESAAGYNFDFSLPTWEPVHPEVMSGFGLESAQMFQLDNIVEVPLTLFQDHQLLYVLGMEPSSAVDFWLEQVSLLKGFDADIVLLIHPDYSFSENIDEYRRLLVSLKETYPEFTERGVPIIFSKDQVQVVN